MEYMKIDTEKEQRKAEAKRLKTWSFKNLTLLTASGILPLTDMPAWLNCIRQARMLDDITAIWTATEIIIKNKDPKAKTAADEAAYDRGLESLVKVSMSGRTSSRGGRRAVQP